MKIEYTKLNPHPFWEVAIHGRAVGKISVQETLHDPFVGVEVQSGFNVHATDNTGEKPAPIPGSPFSSVNHAKAALEYHFRHLTEKA